MDRRVASRPSFGPRRLAAKLFPAQREALAVSLCIFSPIMPGSAVIGGAHLLFDWPASETKVTTFYDNSAWKQSFARHRRQQKKKWDPSVFASGLWFGDQDMDGHAEGKHHKPAPRARCSERIRSSDLETGYADASESLWRPHSGGDLTSSRGGRHIRSAAALHSSR